MAKKDIVIKYYNTQGQYQSDANRMAKQGYEVQNHTVEERRPGIVRCCSLGIFAFLFKPKPVHVVTYRLRESLPQ